MIDPTTSIEELLGRTGAAHGVYEETELGGVYHEEWAEWYAAYALEHGLADLLGRPVTADALASFLAASNVDFQRAGGTDTEPWATYTARRIVAEM